MNEMVLTFEWKEDAVEKIPVCITIKVGGKDVKMALEQAIWICMNMTYQCKYRQMED